MTIDAIIATPDGDTSWGADMRQGFTEVRDRLRVLPNDQAGAYTLVATDVGKAVDVDSASAVDVTVPPNSSVAFPVGAVVEVAQLGAGQVTLAPGAGVTLSARDGTLRLAGQYAVASLRQRAVDVWVVTGDLVA